MPRKSRNPLFQRASGAPLYVEDSESQELEHPPWLGYPKAWLSGLGIRARVVWLLGCLYCGVPEAIAGDPDEGDPGAMAEVVLDGRRGVCSEKRPKRVGLKPLRGVIREWVSRGVAGSPRWRMVRVVELGSPVGCSGLVMADGADR